MQPPFFCLLCISFLPICLIGQTKESAYIEESFPFESNVPEISLIHKETVYPAFPDNPWNWKTPAISEFQPSDELTLQFSQNPKHASNIQSYQLYGVKIYHNQGYKSTRQLVYQAPGLLGSFQEQFSYSMRDIDINADQKGGTYYLEIDSIFVVSSSGRRHWLTTHKERICFPFIILPESDPFTDKNGFPEFSLLINGTPYQENQFVEKRDEIRLLIRYPDSIDVSGSTFTIGYTINEKGCFGGAPAWKSETEKALPTILPNAELSAGFGGRFYVQIYELYRVENDGKTYRIDLPYQKQVVPFLIQPRRP